MTSGRSKDEKRKRRAKRKAHHDKQHERSKPHAVLAGRIADDQCTLSLHVCHPHHQDRSRPIKAIIDTGATNSTIRSDIVKSLGLPVVGAINCVTVHGTKQAPLVVVELIVRDGQTNTSARRVIQAVVPDEQTDEMLFGMDAMKGGVLMVDTTKSEWSWRLTKVRGGGRRR